MRPPDSDRAVAAARLASQGIAGPPARTVESVVERVLAVQGQDPRGTRLSIRSRSRGLRAADVDRALTETRSVVVTTLNRGTLHLVLAEDYWWLHPITTPQLRTGNQRRLRQEGDSPAQAERGVAVVVEAVGTDGPQTRDQLRRRLEAAGVPTKGQALAHVLQSASIDGHVVRGPMVGNEHAFASVPDWLGPRPAPVDRDTALARLATRYLVGHHPAEPHDLAKWAGITLGEARRAFGAANVPKPRKGAIPPPRLLGIFDPLLHGWASREPFVAAHGGVVTTKDIFQPVALVDGRVVATWTMPRGTVSIAPLVPIAPDALDALHADAADVARYLGVDAELA